MLQGDRLAGQEEGLAPAVILSLFGNRVLVSQMWACLTRTHMLGECAMCAHQKSSGAGAERVAVRRGDRDEAAEEG